MKRLYLILFATAALAAIASCAKEDLVDPGQANQNEVTALTISFDETKTSLVDGKTRWAAGDVVRIYDSSGSFYEDKKVSEADAGKTSINVEVKMKDKVFYAVYPSTAAAGIDTSKVLIRIPNDPDGRFSSANICAAKGASDAPLKLRNVTAVMKVTVSSGNAVEFIQLSAANGMTGTYKVGLEGDTPAVSAVSPSKSAKVAIGGIDGVYYIPVAPGVYAKDFSLTALRGNGGYQTLRSKSDNAIAINTIVDMGMIGDNLTTGLSGEGTSASPYLISNLGEYTAFAASVNMGNQYSGKYLSLTTDVDNVQSPIGYYYGSDDQAPFCGHFLGNGHTISLDIDGTVDDYKDYKALFGLLGEKGCIDGLKLTGIIKSSGKYAAGLVAYSRGTTVKDAEGKDVYSNEITNCESSVAVEGGECVGGMAGYATMTNVRNCKNTGTVKAKFNAGGMVGYFYQGLVEKSTNSGSVSATEACGGVLICPTGYHVFSNLDGSDAVGTSTIPAKGVGGITGWTQNVNLTDNLNSAEIKGVSKVGGVAGSLYWSTSKGNANTGNITGTQDFIGGIVGWTYTNSNNIDDVNVGNITGRAAVGGIAGMTNGGRSNGIVTVKDCRNNGSISASNQIAGFFYNNNNNAHIDNLAAAGGIVGLVGEYQNQVAKLSGCVNNGTVYGKGTAVGGIIGLRECPLNGTRGGYADACINNGNIESGLHRAGGIVGMDFQRFTSGVFIIRNCANHGVIKAPNVVAGIVGYLSVNYATTDASAVTGYHETVLNCYNDGKIIYKQGSYNENAGPYASGIVGFTRQGLVENVVNYGAITPETGSYVATDLYLGETVGFLGRIVEINHLFCSSSSSFPMYFASPNNSEMLERKIGDVTGRFNAEGTLDEPVALDGDNYDKIIPVLNYWVSKNNTDEVTYKTWKLGSKGPVFED
jgi:hypothetical protein